MQFGPRLENGREEVGKLSSPPCDEISPDSVLICNGAGYFTSDGDNIKEA